MKRNFVIILGFSLLGLVIGYITGINSSEISQSILTALFALIGGKIFLDFKNEDVEKNKVAGAILSAFSILLLIGLNTGIYIKVNKLFTMGKNYEEPYLRKFSISDDLIKQYKRGEVSKDSIITILLLENDK